MLRVKVEGLTDRVGEAERFQKYLSFTRYKFTVFTLWASFYHQFVGSVALYRGCLPQNQQMYTFLFICMHLSETTTRIRSMILSCV